MSKKLLIIIIAAVVVIGAAAFVFFSGMLTGGAEEPVDKPIELSYYIPGESFVTNLVDSRMLLKANISLGFDKTTIDTAVLDENQSKIRDIINREMRLLTEMDVNDPAILDILKDQLIAALSDGMEFDNLHDVRFTDFVAQ